MDPVHLTRLKLMGQSPAHYQAAVEPEGGAIDRGGALHAILLGGRRYLAYPGKVRRGKEYERFCADNADAVVLAQKDFDRALGMAAAVRACKPAMRVLEGQHELEINWQYLGRDCQSHLDVLGTGYITELKSAASSDPDRFTWQAIRMGYNAQLAFYREAVIAAGLGVPKEAYVVAVESSAPFVVTVMRLTARALDQGARSCRLWMERLLACEAANDWPGYAMDIVPLDVPEEDVPLVFSGVTVDADGVVQEEEDAA
jgi:hypothetical protein